MHVRPGTRSDQADLEEACLALAMESEGLTPDRMVVRAGLERALRRGSARYFVAEDNEFLGCLYVTREWSDWNAGWYWWIQGVYVMPAHRGEGVYKALYAKVHDAARAVGDVKAIRLYVHDTNQAARDVYKAMGMREEAYRIFDAPVQNA